MKCILSPHQRFAVLKSHILLDPLKELDDRMCKMNNKITDLYCRTDQACVCFLCFRTDHKVHNVVLLEEEYETMLGKKDEALENIRKLMQSWSEKIAEVENSLDVGEIEIMRAKDATVQVFTDLIQSIQRGQAELVEAIEERHQATKQKAEGFLKELRVEFTELESLSSCHGRRIATIFSRASQPCARLQTGTAPTSASSVTYLWRQREEL